MNIGESIYRLRTEKGMSQGDLADALEVSRQSVSKWETGGSVPDLDKLVKMSALFGVTLDELVKGEAPVTEQQPQPDPEPRVIYVERAEPAYPRRKVVGMALYGMALLVVLLCTVLGNLLAGVFLSFPLWVCGVICFLFKQRIGLWCSWALFFLVDVYLRFTTGISWGSVRALVRALEWESTLRLWVSLALAVVVIALLLWTVWSYRNRTLEPDRRVTVRLACLLLVLATTWILPWSVSYFGQKFATDGQSLFAFVRVSQTIGAVTQWVKLVAGCRLLIDLFAVRRWKRAQ